MITRFATMTGRWAAYLAFMFVLAACGGGGGGGDGGGGFLPDDDDDEAVYFLSLALYDGTGNPTNTVTSTEPATLEVTVTEGGPGGAPVTDTVVSASSELADILPEAGTALTDASGVATFEVHSAGEQGAGTVEVSVDAPDETVTESISFQVSAADLRLGHYQGAQFISGEIGVSSDNIPRGGTAILTVFVVDGNDEPIDTAETIEFSSVCERSGQSTITPLSADTENGRVQVEYTGDSCAGEDTITATLAGSSSSAEGTITVASPQVTSVVFDSAESEVLALKGTGGGTGLQETGYVFFRIIDRDNQPLPGVEASFALTTHVGGLALVNTVDTSDEEGLVSALVQSGDVATSVRVTATITAEDPSGSPVELTTVSDVLAVTTGLPDQNSISISASSLSVSGAREYDGITADITVRMADKFNNPVPDGTAATFRTEYGSIQGSCATTDGACTVTWTSQEPRFPTFNQEYVRTTRDDDYSCPSHNGSAGPCPDDLKWIRGLRTEVLVTAIGEESFTDQNANGRYDQGEPFENLTEAYIDHNEDDRFTPDQGCVPSNQRCEIAGSEETFVDYDGDGLFSYNVSPTHPDGVFNGVLCPEAGDGDWCSRELLHVRDSITLIMASESGFDILLTTTGGSVVSGTNQGGSYIVYIADIFNNAPPGGTTISFSADDSGAPEGAEGCEIVGPSSFEMPDTNARGAAGFPLQTTGNGTITVTVDAGGPVTAATFSCSAPLPAPED